MRIQCHILPKILVEVGISNLLQWLDVVDGDEVTVQVHKLNAALLERSLGQQMTLDPNKEI